MSSNPTAVNHPPLINVAATTASEICASVYLKEDALKLLQPGMDPRQYVETLVEKKQYIAAIDFIAHALPPRAGIWWGCLCLQHVAGGKLAGWEKVAFKATVRWVMQPSNENREAAKQPAEVAGIGKPAGALAAAANQTGGSLVPPNIPPIPPHPFAPARSLAIAVKVASTQVEGVRIKATQRSFVDLGMAIAEGRFLPKDLE